MAPWRKRRKARPTTPVRPEPKPEGVLVSTDLRRYRVYRLDPDKFQIWREDVCDVRSMGGFPLERVVADYKQREAHEDETSAALATNDPKAMCRIGWHRTVPVQAWFTLANGGRRGSLLVYWVGRAPFQYRCTWIMSMAGVPFACGVCGREIDADTSRLPYGWVPPAERRWVPEGDRRWEGVTPKTPRPGW